MNHIVIKIILNHKRKDKVDQSITTRAIVGVRFCKHCLVLMSSMEKELIVKLFMGNAENRKIIIFCFEKDYTTPLDPTKL